MSDDKIRVLIVEGRFYSDLADALLAGATDALGAFGAEYDIITVPGALEIPAVIAIAEEAGAKGVRYDGYVALGTVTNLAARLCEARPRQVLVVSRVLAALDELVDVESLGDVVLKGFLRPVPVFNVLRLRR